MADEWPPLENGPCLSSSPPEGPENLVAELRQLISEARRQAAATVNVALTVLYWRVGDRIRSSILGSERAAYGERILATLSQELVGEFGRGFDVTNLTRMMKFAEAFPTRRLLRPVATIELVPLPGTAAARASPPT